MLTSGTILLMTLVCQENTRDSTKTPEGLHHRFQRDSRVFHLRTKFKDIWIIIVKTLKQTCRFD